MCKRLANEKNMKKHEHRSKISQGSMQYSPRGVIQFEQGSETRRDDRYKDEQKKELSDHFRPVFLAERQVLKPFGDQHQGHMTHCRAGNDHPVYSVPAHQFCTAKKILNNRDPLGNDDLHHQQNKGQHASELPGSE